MSLTRRSVLFGSAAVAFGLSATACGRIGLPGTNPVSLPSARQVSGSLRELVQLTGRETFQLVVIYPSDSPLRLTAELLMPDGGVQSFTYDQSWKQDDYKEKSLLTSPASARIAELPLDRLAAYTGAVHAEIEYLRISVDYVGKIQVSASVTGAGDEQGLKLDGTGPVPKLNPDDVAGVAAAITEMVATYGSTARKVGSFNGFVHLDANVAGCQAGLRIVRYPKLAAQAAIIQEVPFSPSELFDPSDFDPTMAVTRKATIADEAHVEGTVWDWDYQRPPQGGEPLLSYGIGSSSPDTRVWLNKNGTIAAVVTGNCPPDTGWCPN